MRGCTERVGVCAFFGAGSGLWQFSVSLVGPPTKPLTRAVNCNDIRYTFFRLESSKIRLNLTILLVKTCNICRCSWHEPLGSKVLYKGIINDLLAVARTVRWDCVGYGINWMHCSNRYTHRSYH